MLLFPFVEEVQKFSADLHDVYGSGHEGAAVLLPGFAIKW